MLDLTTKSAKEGRRFLGSLRMLLNISYVTQSLNKSCKIFTHLLPFHALRANDFQEKTNNNVRHWAILCLFEYSVGPMGQLIQDSYERNNECSVFLCCLCKEACKDFVGYVRRPARLCKKACKDFVGYVRRPATLCKDYVRRLARIFLKNKFLSTSYSQASSL